MLMGRLCGIVEVGFTGRMLFLILKQHCHNGKGSGLTIVAAVSHHYSVSGGLSPQVVIVNHVVTYGAGWVLVVGHY